MSAEMFATVVIARLRPVEQVEVESHRGLDLELRVRGEAYSLHLEPYYARYRAAPGTLTPIVQEVIESLSGRSSPVAGAPEYERVAESLMPLLMTSAEWQRKRTAGLRLVVQPLVEDLGTTLVIDEPEGITYVELRMFSSWGIDPATAYDQAIRNLAERSYGVEVTQVGEGEETLLIDRAEYAAERVLLPSRLQDWSERVAGELLLGIPQPHFLIGFSRANPARAELAAQVEKDAQGEHGLMAKLLVYRDGELGIAS